MGNFDLAVEDWDEVVKLVLPQEPQFYRAERVYCMLHAGMTTKAVSEVNTLVKRTDWDADWWCIFASVYAVVNNKVVEKKHEYANSVMEMLQKGVKTGYNNAANLARDNFFNPLRDRDDFKKLLAELETKFPPKWETLPPPRKE